MMGGCLNTTQLPINICQAVQGSNVKNLGFERRLHRRSDPVSKLFQFIESEAVLSTKQKHKYWPHPHTILFYHRSLTVPIWSELHSRPKLQEGILSYSPWFSKAETNIATASTNTHTQINSNLLLFHFSLLHQDGANWNPLVLLKSLPVLILFLTLTHAAALANPFAGVDTSDLDTRSDPNCIYNCKCEPNASPGVYCGYCWAVKSCPLGSPCNNDVYQCGHNGNCCSFGKRDSCAKGADPCPENSWLNQLMEIWGMKIADCFQISFYFSMN